MKIALLNVANNITDFGTVSSGETINIKIMLEKMKHQVDIISKNKGLYTISFEDVQDINSYDKLLVINGALNFFGGKENPIIIKNYKLMAKYNKTIYYLLTDLRLPYRSLWKAICKRDWGYTEEEVSVKSKIVVISQFSNLDEVKKIHKNETISKFVYFPFERYKLVNRDKPHEDQFNLFDYIEEEKQCDIIYGGSFRAGNRENKMNKYLFDIPNLDVEFYGTANLEQFDKSKYSISPKFTGKVSMKDIVDKNSTGYASIIIGDNSYNNNGITLRVWETMLSKAICFIDLEFDKNKSILENDFFYVDSKQEFIEKVTRIKSDELLRKQLLEYQHNRIDVLFNKEKYLEELEKILNEN